MTAIVANDADEWRDLASRSFVPLAFQRAAPRFTATLDRRDFGGGVSLSKIQSGGVVIERTARLASSADSNDVHVSLQLSSTGHLAQGERRATIGPGVVTIAETHRPFTLDYSAPGQQHVVLQVPRARLAVDDATVRRGSGRAIAGQNPARDAYVAFVMSQLAIPGGHVGLDGAEVGQLLCTLAGAMLQTAFSNDACVPVDDETLFVEMSTYIRSRLSSPLLTPEHLAAAHFVSRRRVYSIFALRGTTPAEFIRAERIACARERLDDPTQATTPIAELAFAIGFSDVTTFTRSFRRETGMSPREWRARALGL